MKQVFHPIIHSFISVFLHRHHLYYSKEKNGGMRINRRRSLCSLANQDLWPFNFPLSFLFFILSSTNKEAAHNGATTLFDKYSIHSCCFFSGWKESF